MSIETYPTIDVYSVCYAGGGNEIAYISFKCGAIHGKGEMIDSANTMICEKAN